MHHVGYTGTQSGMTNRQKLILGSLFDLLVQHHGAMTLHHGDCVGGDAEAHAIALVLGLRVVIHPPANSKRQAFCKGPDDRVAWRPARAYLERNREISDESQQLLAAPKGMEEEMRSGTWSTVRYARKTLKPTTIIWPHDKEVP